MTDFSGLRPVQALTALGIAAGLLVLVAVVVTLARRKLHRAPETEGESDDFFLTLVRRTSILLFVPMAIHAGFRGLRLDPEIAGPLRVAVRLALIAQTALWVTGVLDFLLRRYRRARVETDPSAVTTVGAFRFAALVIVWTIATLVALDNLGVNVTALVTGLGIGGVAIALATQNILSDLFASLSIVLDKPFVVGDFIVVGTDMGTVERIGMKTTRVRSLGGELLVFSNSDLLKSRIRNFKVMHERRVVSRIGVVYETPGATLQRIPSLVKGLIEGAAPVRFDRSHFAALGNSACEFEFVYYVLSPDYNVYMDVQQEINLAIVRAFEAEGIGIAYPTQRLVVQQPERES